MGIPALKCVSPMEDTWWHAIQMAGYEVKLSKEYGDVNGEKFYDHGGVVSHEKSSVRLVMVNKGAKAYLSVVGMEGLYTLIYPNNCSMGRSYVAEALCRQLVVSGAKSFAGATGFQLIYDIPDKLLSCIPDSLKVKKAKISPIAQFKTRMWEHNCSHLAVRRLFDCVEVTWGTGWNCITQLPRSFVSLNCRGAWLRRKKVNSGLLGELSLNLEGVGAQKIEGIIPWPKHS